MRPSSAEKSRRQIPGDRASLDWVMCVWQVPTSNLNITIELRIPSRQMSRSLFFWCYFHLLVDMRFFFTPCNASFI